MVRAANLERVLSVARGLLHSSEIETNASQRVQCGGLCLGVVDTTRESQRTQKGSERFFGPSERVIHVAGSAGHESSSRIVACNLPCSGCAPIALEHSRRGGLALFGPEILRLIEYPPRLHAHAVARLGGVQLSDR